jgi:type IV pilus assembly protein PilN
MFASAVFGLVIAFFAYWSFQMMISGQQTRNLFLESEVKRLEEQITEVVSVEDEIAKLRARQKAVEDLQSDRNLPVHLLSELTRQLPDGVYITNLRQEGQTVTLQGMAQSNERVSEMLRNLANNTQWFTRPELGEIVSNTISLSPREQRRVAVFNVSVQLVRSSEARKLSVGDTGVSPVEKGK